MNYWTQSKDNVFVAAHRGWSAIYPENTMEAFRAAAALEGVDQIETDVRETKDGRLVLIHDATVDRTTNGTGEVAEMTLDEIRALDAGSWMDPKFAGYRVPTLDEFLDFADTIPNMTFDIEFKVYPEEIGDHAYEIADKILAALDAHDLTRRAVINTFSGKLQFYFHEKRPDLKLHVYFPLRYNMNIRADVFAIAYCACMFRTFYNKMNIASAADFAEMESLGVQPWAGTGVKDEETTKAALDRGAYLITTNHPDKVLAALRKFGKHR